jgi:hypothetical protein
MGIDLFAAIFNQRANANKKKNKLTFYGMDQLILCQVFFG